MASIQDIIKQLEELDAAGSASTFKGKTQQERTQALRTARNSLNLARDINKSDVKGLELRNKHLAAAQRELRADSNAYRVIEKAIDANKEYVKSQEQVTARLKTVKSSLGTFSTAIETGSGDIASYTNSFKDIPFVGTAIQDLGKRLDVNIESFRQLSSVGAAFGQNLVQLRETAASAGLPLADFVDLVGQNSESLAALYGSTTQGAKQFSKLSEQFRTTAISDLAPLGLTVADLNETLLTSLNLQRRSGMFGQLSDDMQIKSATALAKEMDRLAKLTGQNRSALTKNIEAQLSNERFLASLGTMTVETQARVSAFASSIGTLAPGLAEGFQDLIANTGTPVTEASRQLVQNIPEAGNIIRQLSAGTLSSSEAMVALRDAAKRSNESLRGVARTGTVEFARLFGSVNQLASAKLDETAVTKEQIETQDKLTKGLTQFEDASKRLSAGFQSIETGFFATLGSVIGDGTSGINAGMKDLGQFLQNLGPGLQATLFLGKSLGGYLLDKGARVLELTAGVAGGIKLAGGFSGMGGGLGAGSGVGRFAGRAGLAGLGVAGAIGSAGVAGTAKSDGGQLLGLLGSVGGGALAGAQIGAMFGPGGALAGSLLGAAGGLLLGGSAVANNQNRDKDTRAKGTMGMLGLASEPKTSMLQIESGERVLSRAETNAYNRNEVVDTGLASITASLESKFDSMVTAVNKTNSIQEQAVKALNTQVALTAAGNKINDNTRKGVASMGNLV